MAAALLPENETERLADLESYEILDTGPDPRITPFVRLASQLYDVPIVLVSLVDRDRQWFKAEIGLAASETPRELSFCAHAILAPSDVFVIEDATADPRFADNKLVTGTPHIRFYAGAPIVSPSGHALGTLCIIDRKPRSLDAQGRRRLADLAVGVGAVLDLHRCMRRMQQAATHDPLTGLANRALFEPSVAAAVEASLGGLCCAVLYVDLDRFKVVNDTYGHAGGDIVLREVSNRLRRIIRPGDLAARLGGDEFAVLMCGPFPPYAPQLLADRIVAAFAEPVQINASAMSIGCSIGFAVAPDDGRDMHTLVSAADRALYRAKARRGCIVAAASPDRDPLARPRTLEDDLRDAILGGDLNLVWQPYFATGSGEVAGHEALVRWNRPGYGPMSPSAFVPVAEASGLIEDLDAWVLQAACAAAARWPVPQRIAVNISPHWFCMGDAWTMVSSVLKITGFDPERLVLEITERTVMDQPDRVSASIDKLRAHGVRVALDDFGTGYASLGCLKSFAFDELKLDRSFVCDIGVDGRADDIVRAVLALARALGMHVCAEGVETTAQLNLLRSEGCQMVQGFLLARPAPAPLFDAPTLWTRAALTQLEPTP
jgi:diguanylate cyclase (GGDEF)-like protein